MDASWPARAIWRSCRASCRLAAVSIQNNALAALIPARLSSCAVWAINYASTRPDARADRVGCVGLSYGGRMTMLVAALEPRVQVAVISGALNVFQERVQGAGWSCGAQVIPGLLEIGDTPEIGSLIAPRPAIWEAGLRDSLVVPGWQEQAVERLQRAYAAAGRPENFQVHRFDGGHVWNGETAIPLLAKVLQQP